MHANAHADPGEYGLHVGIFFSLSLQGCMWMCMPQMGLGFIKILGLNNICFLVTFAVSPSKRGAIVLITPLHFASGTCYIIKRSSHLSVPVQTFDHDSQEKTIERLY